MTADPQTNEDVVYVVLGYTGEWSSLNVWVAGAYTDKNDAISEAECQKQEDRSNWVIWQKWNSEFWDRGNAAGLQWDHKVGGTFEGKTRAEAAIDLGLSIEPPTGDANSEYTVASVPLNTRGRWGYE